jgi:hypothetical protein
MTPCKLFPSDIRYLNQINALSLASFGKTATDAGMSVPQMVRSLAEGWTPEQFIAAHAQKAGLTVTK